MKNCILTLLIIAIFVGKVHSCSAIVLKNNQQIFLAKNFDWTFRQGVILKNLRGLTKTAYYTHQGSQASWISKYGSITFNQNGKEMPYGGMNEKGLAIEMLWLDLTKYNLKDQKMYVNELEWIQYQLDNFATVEEVTSHLNDFKIYPIKGKIHYILTDPSGSSVIIEYLNGKAMSYPKETQFCQAITNNSVYHSASYKDQIKGLRKNNAVSGYRYHLLEKVITETDENRQWTEAGVFDVLKKVTIPKGDFKTMWSIVYNIRQKSISYYSDSHKKIKSVFLADMDFDHDLSYLDINQDEVTMLKSETLKKYDEKINTRYVSTSLEHLEIDKETGLDISQHQFDPTTQSSSLFAARYFHFEISVPMDEERQTGFLAVMDNEKNFKRRQAVTGGYLYGNIAKGSFVAHIYGLKNGRYAMLAFIDQNQNRKPDFGNKDQAGEKYATFGDQYFNSEKELTFWNTSAEFSSSNAEVEVIWKQKS
ncbi:MAG TPA: linear amide C-N hydrolase [Saprospiraceae bacterium]|nr:linear amide C-N hydrolase [Saprospiraceae bacterium]